jgi:hypothetical protein
MIMPTETAQIDRRLGLGSFDRYPHIRSLVLECQRRWQAMDEPTRINILLATDETLARVFDTDCPSGVIWRIAEINNL